MKEHDPNHPYVRKMVGCGHGVLFTDYCKDCEIVAVQEQYKNAIRTVQRCRNELRRLGVAMPGQTSLPVQAPVHQPVHEAKVCPTCEALARSVMLDQSGSDSDWEHTARLLDAALQELVAFVDERWGDNECRPLENAKHALGLVKDEE